MTKNLIDFPISVEKGINTVFPTHNLPPGFARFMADILVDKPGFIRSRGKVAKWGNLSVSAVNFGIASTLSATGKIFASLSNTTTTGSSITSSLLAENFDSVNASFTWESGTFDKTFFQDCKPRLGGGALIGISNYYMADSASTAVSQHIGMWNGSNKGKYSTGTLTSTANSKAIVGVGTTWTGNVEPGMFVMGDAGAGVTYLIGVIKTVDSNTTITLEENALFFQAAATYQITPLRGLTIKVAKGRITCSTGTAIVTGQNTKFKDQFLLEGTLGTWRIFIQKDFRYIGEVGSVTNNTSLSLTANAGFDLVEEKYVAVRVSGSTYKTKIGGSGTDPSQGGPGGLGFLNVIFNNRQFYANSVSRRGLPSIKNNTTRLWFSEPTDCEALDISEADGDFITIGSGTSLFKPITALYAIGSVLAIFKSDELFILEGNSPESYQVRKIADIGCLKTSSLQPYKDGVIFVSRKGIYSFDGSNLARLTENLGEYFERLLQNFNSNKDFIGSLIYQDHYIVYIENTIPELWNRELYGGTPPTNSTLCLFLKNNAVSFLYNVDIRGSISEYLETYGTSLPSTLPKGSIFSVNTTADNVELAIGYNLFHVQGADTIVCKGEPQTGPYPYFETATYSFNEPSLVKYVKEMRVHYTSQGLLKVRYINTIVDQYQGTLLGSSLPASATFVNGRLALDKRNHYLGLQVYTNTLDNAYNLKIGHMLMKIKYLRRNRVEAA